MSEAAGAGSVNQRQGGGASVEGETPETRNPGRPRPGAAAKEAEMSMRYCLAVPGFILFALVVLCSVGIAVGISALVALIAAVLG